MSTARAELAATLLNDGTVLVTGGQDPTGNEVTLAEVFDSTIGSFKPTGSMSTAREYHTSTLLNGGKVLVTGGVNGSGALATAELFE
jgi:hypothetical protein